MAGRGQRVATAARVSVPVTPEEQRRAAAHVAALGIDARGASKAEIIHGYFVRGLQATERAAREAAELDAYAAFEQDPERRAVAAHINGLALKSGAV